MKTACAAAVAVIEKAEKAKDIPGPRSGRSW
jgi:hypothetical protein